jgi:DNA-binding transcriptional regulator LsrR (DeoR family)
MNSSLEWRRNKVQELSSQGYNQSEISRKLQISQPTINRDSSFLRQQAKHNIKRYIDERLPEEYEKCLVGLNAITREAWNTAHDTEDKREKIHALSLAKECYSMKLDLLTNANVVDDAIRFVSEKAAAAGANVKSKIDAPVVVIEDEEKQQDNTTTTEQQPQHITTTTTMNQVF